MLDWIIEKVYYYGFRAGIALIILPIATDVLWKGGRELSMVSIGTLGVMVQVLGIVLLFCGGRDSK